MNLTAPPAGYGVPPLRPRAKRSTVVNAQVDAKLGLTDDWSDKPTIKNQLDNPEMWRKSREEVKIFDLSIPDQLSAYNEILTRTTLPDTNVFMARNEVKSFDQTQNWKALVQLQYVEYRVILKTKDT